MEQALHPDESVWPSDPREYNEEDEEEEDNGTAETMGPDPAGQRRCNKCGTILSTVPFYNLMVKYCGRCKKYICSHCFYPELKFYDEKGKSGVYCTNCGKPQPA
jgi:hypothetical protein